MTGSLTLVVFGNGLVLIRAEGWKSTRGKGKFGRIQGLKHWSWVERDELLGGFLLGFLVLMVLWIGDFFGEGEGDGDERSFFVGSEREDVGQGELRLGERKRRKFWYNCVLLIEAIAY